jgi:hypothetical protein
MLASNTDKVRPCWRHRQQPAARAAGAARCPGPCPARRAVPLKPAFARPPLQRRPPGDREYCNNSMGRSPKQTRWMFDDDTV